MWRFDKGMVMRISLSALLICGLAALSADAVAHGADAPAELTPSHLGDYISEPGEALPDFLKRVGGALHTYTQETGWEACGAIGQAEDRYSVRLFSDRVPHGCAVRTSTIAEGFTFAGETIHSHPWQLVLTLDAHARAWSRFYGDGHQGTSTLRNDGSSGFSRADYATGAGWLVAKGQLLHQASGKTTRLGPVR
jgi:hypothetical protein